MNAIVERFFNQAAKTSYTIETTKLAWAGMQPPRLSREVVSTEKAQERITDLAEGKTVFIEKVLQPGGGEIAELVMIDYKAEGGPMSTIS